MVVILRHRSHIVLFLSITNEDTAPFCIKTYPKFISENAVKTTMIASERA